MCSITLKLLNLKMGIYLIMVIMLTLISYSISEDFYHYKIEVFNYNGQRFPVDNQLREFLKYANNASGSMHPSVLKEIVEMIGNCENKCNPFIDDPLQRLELSTMDTLLNFPFILEDQDKVRCSIMSCLDYYNSTLSDSGQELLDCSDIDIKVMIRNSVDLAAGYANVNFDYDSVVLSNCNDLVKYQDEHGDDFLKTSIPRELYLSEGILDSIKFHMNNLSRARYTEDNEEEIRTLTGIPVIDSALNLQTGIFLGVDTLFKAFAIKSAKGTLSDFKKKKDQIGNIRSLIDKMFEYQLDYKFSQNENLKNTQIRMKENDRINKINQKAILTSMSDILKSTKVRIEALVQIGDNLDSLNSEAESLNSDLDKVNKQIEKMNDNIEQIDKEIDELKKVELLNPNPNFNTSSSPKRSKTVNRINNLVKEAGALDCDNVEAAIDLYSRLVIEKQFIKIIKAHDRRLAYYLEVLNDYSRDSDAKVSLFKPGRMELLYLMNRELKEDIAIYGEHHISDLIDKLSYIVASLLESLKESFQVGKYLNVIFMLTRWKSEDYITPKWMIPAYQDLYNSSACLT